MGELILLKGEMGRPGLFAGTVRLVYALNNAKMLRCARCNFIIPF